MDGQAGRDLVTAARARAGLHGAAYGGGALAHPGLAVPGRPARGAGSGAGLAVAVPGVGLGAVPGVGHVDIDLIGMVAERDGRIRRAGVADDVGQRLLDDAVGGQVDGGRQRERIPGHGERDRQAGAAGSFDQGVELGQARGGLNGVGVVGLAEHVEDGAQLPEAFLAGGLDGLQGLGGRLRLGGQHVGGHPGLHVDGGHGVGHHVVQFPGDTQPLLVHLPPGVLGGPVADRGHVGAPVGHRDPGEQRGGDHERDDVEAAAVDVPERVVGGGDRHQHGQRHRGGRHRPAQADLGGHRVQGQDRGDQGGAVDVTEQRVDGHRGSRDGQHGERVTAPPGQRQARDRDQRQRGRRMRRRVAMELVQVELMVGMTLAVGAEHQDEGHQQRTDQVRDRRGEPAPPGRREILHGRSVGTRRALVALPRLTIRLLPGE